MAGLAGIFVGGAGARMGGVAKGLLAVEGEPIVRRLERRARAVGLDVVLVGRRPEYESLGIRVLDDDPPGIGPMGGLRALLRAASASAAPALALACDMPRVSEELLRVLRDAPAAPLVAPRRADRWEPMLARFEPERVLPVIDARIARGDHSLQRLFDEVGAAQLVLTPVLDAELHDWDSPGDLERT
jgi:molybdopterin-guanine dinucleotide biosynthesis protein A